MDGPEAGRGVHGFMSLTKGMNDGIRYRYTEISVTSKDRSAARLSDHRVYGLHLSVHITSTQLISLCYLCIDVAVASPLNQDLLVIPLQRAIHQLPELAHNHPFPLHLLFSLQVQDRPLLFGIDDLVLFP